MSLLRDNIRKDYLTAYKARDMQKMGALRNIEVALKNLEVDTRKELEDSDTVAVLKRELKKREESIELYKKGGRQDLVEVENFEAEIIKQYLPAMMSREDVEKIVDGAVTEAGDGANFGQVMQLAIRKTAGNADNKMVAEVVKEKLQK
jgi:uncharacterized protein YqeY